MRLGIFFFSLLIFLSFWSCKNKNVGVVKDFKVWVEPKGGIYPEYQTFFVKIFSTKEAEICWTTNGESPKPCERSFVRRGKISAGESITIPVQPIYDEGATLGVFPLNILAIDKESREEKLIFEKFDIVLAPYVRVNPKGGFYNKPITVSLGCNKPCIIHYTLDGSEPTENSPQIKDGGIFEVKNDTTIKFFAKDTVLGIKSVVREEEYFIDSSPPRTRVFGIESCKCEIGCDNPIPTAVRCDSAISLQLVATDDKSPTSQIYYSIDGRNPSDETDALYEFGGNTYSAKDSVSISISSHTIVKFFSVDIAKNKEDVRTIFVLIGQSPMGYADPPGGVFGGDKIPIKVKLNTIPADAKISYTISYPTGETNYVETCTPPCEITIDKEGKNILTFRAFKGGLYDIMRREDYVVDKTPPDVSIEPQNCFSDSGPIQLTIKSNEEKTRVFWRICQSGVPGCNMAECKSAPDVLSGVSPVTGVVVEYPSKVFYCGVDRAGNASPIENVECEISGKYEETFQNQDKMDSSQTDADWGGGKLTLKKDQPERVSSLDTSGSGTSEIKAYGKIVAVLDRGVGLRLIDISTPTNPSLISTFSATSAVSFDLWRDVAFILTNQDILAVDISNPRNIRLISSTSLSSLSISPAQAIKIVLWGRNVIVGGGNTGISIAKINFTETSSSKSISLERVGGISSVGDIQDFSLFGNFLFSAEGNQGVRVISLQNPSSPSQITSISNFLQGGELVSAVAQFFPYVVAGTNNGRIYIFILGNNKIEKISELTLASGIRINSIKVFGFNLVIADNQGLKFVDVRDPENPRVQSDLRIGATLSLELFGNYILSGDSTSQLSIIEGVKVEKINKFLDVDGESKKISFGGVLLFNTRGNSFKVFDVSDVLSPREITDFQISPNVSDAVLFGDKVLVGDGKILRFYKANYNFPNQITFEEIKSLDLSQIKSQTTIRRIRLWGDIAFVGTEGAIFAVPITGDISNLDIGGIIKGDFEVQDFEVYGDKVFVATGGQRVIVLKFTGVSFDKLLDSTTSSNFIGLSLLGQYLLSAQDVSGLIFYDVSQVVMGRILQVSSVPFSSTKQVRNFGFFTIALNQTKISVVDNTYIDRPRVILEENIPSQDGEIFGNILFSKDGGLKSVRVGRMRTYFKEEGYAQSINLTPDLKTPIREAQIIVSYCSTQDINCDRFGCPVEFQLSNNGGKTFEDFPANAGFFPFSQTGTSLIWKAKLRTGDPIITPEICKITIIYRFGR